MLRNQNIANSLWNIMDIFLYPVLFFASASFFLQKLGQTQFGIWMLVTSIVVSMQLFNLGIGSSVLKNISFYIGKNDDTSKAGVINSAISFTVLLFILCLFLSFVGYFMVRDFNLFHIGSVSKKVCAQSFIIAGYFVGLKFFEQVFTNYYKALERFKVAALLGSGNRLTALSLNFILLHFFSLGIVQILSVIALVNSLFIATGWMILRKSMNGYRFRFQLAMPSHEASFALLIWLQSICIIITFQSDRYLIVNYFGLVALSYYALIATMFNHLHMGLNAILPWLSPKFTKMHVQNINSYNTYKTASLMVNSISILLLMSFSVTYPFIFKWVLGTTTEIRVHDYTKCFIAFESFFALSILPAYYLNAVGLERTYFYFILLFSALSLICMFSFIQIFYTPIAVIHGLIISCALGMITLILIVEKSVSGNLNIASGLYQILPSVLLCAFVFTETLLPKSIFGMAILSMIYFGNLKGRKQQFLTLIKL